MQSGNESKVDIKLAKRLYCKEGKTLREIGNIFGVSYESVRQKLISVDITGKNVTFRCDNCKVKISLNRRKSRRGNTRLCSVCAYNISHEKARVLNRDKCKCGRSKGKMAIKCMFCRYGHEPIDKALLVQLWNIENYTIRELAEHFKTTRASIGAIMVDMRKKGLHLKETK